MEPIAETLQRLSLKVSPTSASCRTTPEPCRYCGGLGWLRSRAELGQPEFGQLVECPCGLVRSRRTGRLDGTFGFSESLKAIDLGTLTPMRGEQKTALTTGVDYATNPQGWLYLHGPYGCGKTTLMAGIVNAVRAKGTEAVFVVVPELLNWLRACFEPGSGRSFDEDWCYIRAVPLLALDDLGTEKATEWADERLYELTNWRYRQQLLTVVTSNLPAEELRDPRLASRWGDVMLCRAVRVGEYDVRKVRR